MKTMEEVVAAGVAAQASIDKHLTLARKAAEKLAKVTARGVELGMVPKAIKAKALMAEAHVIPGLIASAAFAAAELHAKQTIICQENGVDTPAPASIGGVSTMGGGGR
ncbi:hypothetical protein ACLJYM_06485 [Rhizobium giardinii]|uniref:hypothetical protein n=1 Tax=Rhizobium giardinii TaxID=56731 RepID=UPI0039E0D18C